MLDLNTSTVRKLSFVTVAFSVSTSAQEWGDEQLGTISIAAGWMEPRSQPRDSVQSCQSLCHPVHLVHVQAYSNALALRFLRSSKKQTAIYNCLLKPTIGRYFPLKDSGAELVGSKRQPRNAESIKWHYKNCCLDPAIYFQQ